MSASRENDLPRILAARSGRNIADNLVVVGSHSWDRVAVADAVGRCSCTSTRVGILKKPSFLNKQCEARAAAAAGRRRGQEDYRILRSWSCYPHSWARHRTPRE
jgi:hypothetical protein